MEEEAQEALRVGDEYPPAQHVQNLLQRGPADGLHLFFLEGQALQGEVLCEDVKIVKAAVEVHRHRGVFEKAQQQGGGLVLLEHAVILSQQLRLVPRPGHPGGVLDGVLGGQVYVGFGLDHLAFVHQGGRDP